jgi:hypothetical protein
VGTAAAWLGCLQGRRVLSFFAQLAGFEEQALAGAKVSLAEDDSAAGARRCTRLLQACELLFRDTLADAF